MMGCFRIWQYMLCTAYRAGLCVLQRHVPTLCGTKTVSGCVLLPIHANFVLYYYETLTATPTDTYP